MHEAVLPWTVPNGLRRHVRKLFYIYVNNMCDVINFMNKLLFYFIFAFVFVHVHINPFLTFDISIYSAEKWIYARHSGCECVETVFKTRNNVQYILP